MRRDRECLRILPASFEMQPKCQHSERSRNPARRICGAIENACAFSRPRSKCNPSVNIRSAQGIQSRCRDQRVAVGTTVGYVELGATKRCGVVDRQNALRERWQHLSVEPGSEDFTLPGISTLDPQHADLQFEHRDRGTGRATSWARLQPTRGRCGLRQLRPSATPIRRRCRAGTSGQIRSGVLNNSSESRGGSNSISSASGRASRSTMVTSSPTILW